MKIGIISGDVYHVDPHAKATNPDCLTQGLMLAHLLNAGHDIYFNGSLPRGTTGLPSMFIDLRDPRTYDGWHYREEDLTSCDVIIVDKLRAASGVHFDRALQEIRQTPDVPKVFHQYIGFPGHAPPFVEHRDLVDQRWFIMGRSEPPVELWTRSVGRSEGKTPPENVEFRQFAPFFQIPMYWPFGPMDGRTSNPVYDLGYLGRLPMSDKRSQMLLPFFKNYDGSKIIYAKHSEWFARASGSNYGGPGHQHMLADHYSQFAVTLVAPYDAFHGMVNWPNRIVEAACAGVLQLFLPGFGDQRFAEWEIHTDADLREWMEILASPDDLDYAVRRQQNIILPHADPVTLTDKLVKILEEATQ